MIQMKLHILRLVFLLSLTYNFAFAQPVTDDFILCHNALSHLSSGYKPTEQEMAMMENSNRRSDSFDIWNYVIDIDVTNYAGKAIKANTAVRFRTRLDKLQWIVLDLLDLQVDSVYFEGKPVLFNYDSAQIVVFFGRELPYDHANQVTVYYHGVPSRDPVWGGFYFADDYIYNLGIGLSTTPPNFGKVWFPCFDNFVERSTYDYYVTSTSDKKAYCVGTFMSEDSVGPSRIRRHYRMNTPIPTYLSSIAVANYAVSTMDHQGIDTIIPIQLIAKPGDLSKMVSQFEKMGQAIDAFEYWFGPYRFERVGYVATTVGAMEHPTNVAYPISSILNSTLIQNERLYGHELGHHWWGDITTLDDARDMWIKEGNAEYSSHLFIERAYGKADFTDAVKSNLSNIIFNAHRNDGAYLPLSPMPYSNTYGTHTYRKGAAMIHNLRGYLGDDRYRQVCTMLFDSLYGKSMNAFEFRDFLSRNSGMDMTAFFDDYIFNPGYCGFYVDSSQIYQNGGKNYVRIRLQQKSHHAAHLYRDVPIELAMYDQNMKRSTLKLIAGDTVSYFDIPLPDGFTPAIYILNENQELNLATLQNNAIINKTGTANLPYTGMVVNVSGLTDSSYVNIAHQLMGPDTDRKAANIKIISPAHFWQVSVVQHGDLIMDGRVEYNGADSLSIDKDILFKSEDSLLLVYRKNHSEPWVEYPDYNKLIVSPNDRKGFVRITKLIAGEYALANGYHQVVQSNDLAKTGILMYPNPVKDNLYIHSRDDSRSIEHMEIYDASSRLVMRMKAECQLDLTCLNAGYYEIVMFDQAGKMLYRNAIIKE